MKRPALAVSLILLAAAALFYMYGTGAPIIMSVVLLLIAALCAVFRRRILGGRFTATVLLLASLLCLIMTAGSFAKITKAEALVGKTMSVTAKVTEEPDEHGTYTSLEVKTEKDGEGLSLSGIKLRIYVDSSDDAAFSKVGDIITFEGKFSMPNEQFRSSLYAKGIFVSCLASDVKTVAHRYTPYETCVALRNGIRNRIREHLSGDNAALACGIMLGDISGISDRLYSDLKICGVSHIVAISGLHIGIMCSAVMGLFSLIFKRRTAKLLSLAAVLLAVAVTGFTPSAIRAGIMCAAAFGAGAALRCKDSLNSLGIAVILMLLYEPFYVLDVGFGLSCSATAGVIVTHAVTGKTISDKIKINNFIVQGIVQNALSVAAQSVGASIFTLPVMVIVFGYVSTVSPLANIAISFAAGNLLLILLPAVIISSIPFIGILCKPFFVLAALFCEYISAAVGLIAKIPFSYIPFGSSLALFIVGMCVALTGVWILCSRPGGIKLLSVMLSMLTVIGLWSHSVSFKNTLQISSVYAGTGYCTIIKYNKTCVVIGCGDDKKDVYSVSSLMKTASIGHIDTLIMPRGDIFWGGFDAFTSGTDINNIVLTDDTLLAGHKTDGTVNISICGEGEMFKAGSDKLTFCIDKGGRSVLLLFGSQKFAFGANSDILPQDADYIIALSPPRDGFCGIYMSSIFCPQSFSDAYTVIAPGGSVSVSIKEGKEPAFYAVE